MLKFFVTSFDKSRAICNIVNDKILRNLVKFCGEDFQRVRDINDSNVIFVIHNYRKDYIFDSELAKVVTKLNKPIIMFDFVEAGVHKFPSIFAGIRGIERYSNKSFEGFFDFFATQLPNVKLYFKRELLESEDLTKFPFVVKPIEYSSRLPKYNKDTKEEFNKRLIDIYMVWGYSNYARPLLHAELMKRQAYRSSSQLICSHSYLYRTTTPHKVVLIYTPYFLREPLSVILEAQRNTKISISLNGNGQKCFRHSESPWNSIMAMKDTNLVWTYPWIDGKNCIRLPVVGETRKLDEVASVKKMDCYLNQPDKLYQIYLEGSKTMDDYTESHYVPKYIAKEILEVMK